MYCTLPNNAGFGLGSMVYIGIEFGSWFEIPWDSPCYQVSIVRSLSQSN
jgi:hypothetical protein